jgi:hypothetical protein
MQLFRQICDTTESGQPSQRPQITHNSHKRPNKRLEMVSKAQSAHLCPAKAQQCRRQRGAGKMLGRSAAFEE